MKNLVKRELELLIVYSVINKNDQIFIIKYINFRRKKYDFVINEIYN